MEYQDMQALAKLLEGKPDPDPEDTKAMRQLAKDILLRDWVTMTAEVTRELSRQRQARIWGQEYAGRQYYIFLAPIPKGAKAEIVWENDTAIGYKEPQRQPYRVRVRDMAAFCKENKLDEGEMVKLGMGEIPSHRGWSRQAGQGHGLHLGKEYREPASPAPTPEKAKFHVFQYAPTVKDWTPTDK